MSTPENSDLPKANGQIGPAYFDDEKGKFDFPRGTKGTPYVDPVGIKEIRIATLTVLTRPSLVTAGLENKKKVLLRVAGDSPVFIGHNTQVTTNTGFPLLPGECHELGGTIYAIASSSQELKIMEIR